MEILRESKELFDYLVKARRQFHENPELSGEEWETLKYIRNELDDMGIEYSAVDKIVVTASANHEKALAAVIADSQAEKTLLRNNFTNIGVSAYSADGRTFYWCIFVTK